MTLNAVDQSVPLVNAEAIREAARGLAGVAVRTPLKECQPLSLAAGVPVYLKCEHLQPTGAFKLRGAWTAVRRLSEEARARGIITFSSGNHGQAVAFAARRLGVRAVVVMPEHAPRSKVEGVKRWGGEVVFAGKSSEERLVLARERVEREGFTMVPPFDHADVVAGQGTVGLEIAEDLPDVAHVAVPVGGGGLLAGVTIALAEVAPAARVTAVEPVGAACLKAALDAGRVVRLDRSFSIADGLMPVAVGAIPLAHVQGRVNVVLVTEDQIAETTVWLGRQGYRVEPSGAATTAALRAGLFRPTGPTVLIVSGGNVDDELLKRLAGGTVA